MKWNDLVRQISASVILSAYYDETQLIGFTYLYLTKPAAYLSYFAVEPSLRGRGCGTSILNILTGTYPDTKIIVDIEQTDNTSANAEERRHRKNFYLHNGFEETGIFYNFWFVDYELLSIHGRATKEEWDSIASKIWGKYAKSIRYE